MRQDMTMDEVMEYQGRLYFLPKKQIREKSEELLDFAGLKADQVTFTKVKPDRDDGRMVYEIEFVYNGIEYEMDVDQLTGRITDFDKDYFHGHDRDDDDWDDFFDFD